MKQGTETVTVTSAGLAIGQIVVYALDQALTEPMPNEVAIAVGTVITGALLFCKHLYTNWRQRRHDETDTHLGI